MTKLEIIRQKVEADQQQEAQREAKLADLRKQIGAMDVQINDAIDAGQDAAAKKLIAKQNDLRSDLEFAERVGHRKIDQNRYFGELIEISKEAVAELQPKADKLYAEMEKTRKAYLEKKVALARILCDAAHTRAECCHLAGLGPAYEDLRYNEMPCVTHDRWALDVYFHDRDDILQIEPEFFNLATFANNYGEFSNDQ